MLCAVPLLTNCYLTVVIGGGEGGGQSDSFSRKQSKNAREYFCQQVFLWCISNTNNKQMQKQTKKTTSFVP